MPASLSNRILYGDGRPTIEINEFEFTPIDGNGSVLHDDARSDAEFQFNRLLSLRFEGLNESIRLARRGYKTRPDRHTCVIDALEAVLQLPSWLSIRKIENFEAGSGSVLFAYDTANSAATFEHIERFVYKSLATLVALEAPLHVESLNGRRAADEARIKRAS